MKRKTAFLFSGQGSQYFQMGRGLYEQNPGFRACMDRMDSIVHDLQGISVLRALYGGQGKGEVFDDIRLTHPAIFMVEYALAQAVIGLGIEPECTLGASLGTFAALAVAGRVGMEDALGMVVRQAQAIEAHCPRGGMVALLAPPRLYEDSPFLQARSVVAGRNFDSHFVLSAPQPNLAAIQAYLLRAGVSHQVLPVHYPFHAPWIEPLRGPLAASGDGVRWHDSATPVVCCALGGVLGAVPQDYFWTVAREEIAFMRTLLQLEQLGPFDYLDLGPSGTLANFVKPLLAEGSTSRGVVFMTPFGRDTEVLSAALARLRPAHPSPALGS